MTAAEIGREARRTVDAINEAKRVENRDLRAAWLPSHERCWSCDGTGKQQVFYDGFVFETDEPCDECGGTGRDYPEPEDPADSEHWLPGIDDVSDIVREGDR